jgi:phytanoyl-CoA hydroxylase
MAVAQRVDMERFAAEGYIVLEGLLDPREDLDPVRAEYEELLDRLARRWHAEGNLPATHADLPFAQRFARVLRDATNVDVMQHFDFALPFKGIRPDTPIHVGPEVFRLLTNSRLLDAVEEVVGPEIYSNPIQHVRIKPPERDLPEALRYNRLLAAAQWHQDQGVHLPDADETHMLTVWIPVTDATEENGCLCVVPGSHRSGLATHCTTNGPYIPDALLGGDPLPLPMRRGSVLFMDHLTKHASLSNHSDGIRWSFDLRYQPTGQPTGRPMFPGFVARSRIQPSGALTDPGAWADLWHSTRARLAAQGSDAQFFRWTDAENVCA